MLNWSNPLLKDVKIAKKSAFGAMPNVNNHDLTMT